MQNESSTAIVPIVVTSIFVVVISIGVFVLLNKGGNTLPSTTNSSNDINLGEVEGENMTNIEDFEELTATILKEGKGDTAEVGDKVSVHYEGTLSDGTKFDSSYDRGKPFEFILGNNSVIEGWEEGVKGMKIGEIRELRIPSSMGYGDYGQGPIPGKAGLIFKVELLGISN